MKRIALVLLALGLTACATFHPSPEAQSAQATPCPFTRIDANKTTDMHGSPGEMKCFKVSGLAHHKYSFSPSTGTLTQLTPPNATECLGSAKSIKMTVVNDTSGQLTVSATEC